MARSVYPEQVDITELLNRGTIYQPLRSGGYDRGNSAIIFGKLWTLGSIICACVQSMFSADAQSVAKGSGPSNTEMLRPAFKRKSYVCSVEVSQRNWERLFLWHQDPPPFFRHAWIPLSIRGLPGNCYFFLYILFRVYFIFSCCRVFISYLISPHPHGLILYFHFFIKKK